MQKLLKKWSLTGFLGICLVSSLAYRAEANTGSPITGDGGGGNLDGSTFTGDFFAPPGSSGQSDDIGPQALGIPRDWQCLRRAICSDCDLRLETLATMLNTNLSGTLTQKVIEGAAPRACCDSTLVARAKAHEDIALLSQQSSSAPESPQSFRVAAGGSSAALLDGVKPASLNLQLPQMTFSTPNTSSEVAQAILPAPTPVSGQLNRFPFEAASASPSAITLKNELERTLAFDPNSDDLSQSKKRQALDTLITTLQGLTWEERLQNNAWQKHIDVDQLTSAIKNYNLLISLLSPEELNAWRNDRNGQDVTTVLKKLREGVTLL